MESLLPLLVLVAVFYLLILRPARKKQQEAARVVAALAPGAEVMTAGGIFGTVTAVTDDEVEVEVSPGVTLRMVKQAIGRVVTESPSAAASQDEPRSSTDDTAS